MNYRGDNCFPAGTLVATDVGPKPIETIQAGEKVWARDVAGDTWILCLVSKTFSMFHYGDFASIEVAGETIASTGNHPFWVVEGDELETRRKPAHVASREADTMLVGRWVDARDLCQGDVLLRRSGELSNVQSVESRTGSLVVFNLRVSDLHTYCVGKNEILVHNRNPTEVTGGQSELGPPNTPVPRTGGGRQPVSADPTATGPHTRIGTQPGDPGGRYPHGPYRQGFTFDGEGQLVSRTDVTDHGRPWDHDSPNVHSWGGPNGGWGPPRPVPPE